MTIPAIVQERVVTSSAPMVTRLGVGRISRPVLEVRQTEPDSSPSISASGGKCRNDAKIDGARGGQLVVVVIDAEQQQKKKRHDDDRQWRATELAEEEILNYYSRQSVARMVCTEPILLLRQP